VILSTTKLRSCFAAVAASLFLALLLGRVEMIVFAIPFVGVLVMGAAGPGRVEVQTALSHSALMEGEETTLRLTLSPDYPGELELEVKIPDGLEVVEGDTALVIGFTGGLAISHEVRLRARWWGNYRLDAAQLRHGRASRLRVKEERTASGPRLKVFPLFDGSRRGFGVSDLRLFSGEHVSRVAGESVEFAHVRPFVSGDSVRRINWRVTSRRQSLHVNVTPADLSAQLVLFLDTFDDVSLSTRSTLDATVRGAAALAQHHLGQKDRVGLVGFGGVISWLPAQTGRIQTYRIADFLLDVREYESWAWKDIDRLPHGSLPSGASVIAFSPLVDERALTALADIRLRGFPVVVINTLDESLVATSGTREGKVAHRIWIRQRQLKRAQLRSLGVEVVDWKERDPLGRVLAAIPIRRLNRGRA
jgi:uncharacterized protein (DUF58 family)